MVQKSREDAFPENDRTADDAAELCAELARVRDELARTRQALAHADARFSQAVEGGHLAAWEYDVAKRRIVSGNDVLGRQGIVPSIGDVPDSLVEKGYIASESIEDYLDIYRRVFAGETHVTGSFWGIPNNSQERVFKRISYEVELDASGNPVRAFGIGADDTAAQRERERYEREIAEVMKGTPGMVSMSSISVTGNSRRLDYSAPGHEESFSSVTTYDAFLAHVAQNRPDAAQRSLMRDVFGRAALKEAFHAGKTEISLMTFGRVGDATRHWIRTTVRLTEDVSTGELKGIMYAVDVDDQVKDHAIFQDMTDESYEFIALADPVDDTFELRFRGDDYVEHGLGQVHTLSEMEGMTAFPSVHEDDWEQLVQAMESARAGQTIGHDGRAILDYREYDAEGAIRYKRLICTRLDDPRHLVLIKKSDITDLFEQEQERIAKLKRALDKAEEANRSKSLFLSNVGHDMRTPLNGVIGFTDLALQADAVEEKQRYLELIRDSSVLLAQLVNDTLDLSMIESHKVTLSSRPIKADGLVDGVVTAVRASADAKHLDFRVEENGEDAGYFLGDRLRIQKIVLNLLSNAVKFTPEGGSVALTLDFEPLDEEHLGLDMTVADSGEGMAPEFVPHVFEPFVQENANESVRYMGTGLGLSILKRIVDMMDGTVDVSSVQGEGTTFEVHLVFPRLVDYVPDPVEDAPALSTLAGTRVLLVDDHPLNLELARQLLLRQGVEVSMASDGQKALDAFSGSEQGSVDAIIMDVRMPVMDGLEAARRIRKLDRPDAKTVPIIAMSANAFDDDVARSRAAGMNAHLSKPINPDELYRALALLMAHD